MVSLNYICVRCYVVVILAIHSEAANSNFENVALNKPCTMSSRYPDTFVNNCSCAINGNTGTTYEAGNCIHTDRDTDRNPVWSVSLGQNYTIRSIVIYARGGLEVRMSDASIVVDRATVYTFPSSYGTGGPIETVTHINSASIGSMVYVFITDHPKHDVMLNICEVQVWVCKPGYYGANCDPCVSRCSNSYCDDIANPNDCSVRYCNTNPCANGGTCREGGNTYSCTCTQGYIGTNCTSDVNECERQLCSPGACINTDGSYYCQCPQGYTGSQDCTDVDECSDATRCRNGKCANIPGSFYCLCGEGYTGNGTTNDCVDMDECAGNSSLCKPGNCSNTVGSYTCLCPSGFNGAGTKNCTDVNECDFNSSLCRPGTCSNTYGSFLCSCPPGYAGTNTCSDIDECTVKDILCNGGSCVNTMGSFICLCGPGYTGNGTSTCTDINECKLEFSICNNGTCINNPGSFTCDCIKGYTGKTCEKDADECASRSSANGGTSMIAAQSSENNAGVIVGVFIGGFLFSTSLWILGLWLWKWRNSPNTNNKLQRGHIPETYASSDKSPGATDAETQRQEVCKPAVGCEDTNETYDNIHPYSNDVTPDAAAYTSL